MKSINKLVLTLMSIAVIVGGYALLTTSNDSAEAEKAELSNKLGVVTDLDELGDVDEVDDSDLSSSNKKDKEDDDGEKDDEDDEDETKMSPQTGTITEANAIAIAEANYKGDGKRTDVELEMENGILVYAIEFTEKDGNEVDVKINAKTGVVIKIESDKDEDEEDDD